MLEALKAAPAKNITQPRLKVLEPPEGNFDESVMHNVVRRIARIHTPGVGKEEASKLREEVRRLFAVVDEKGEKIDVGTAKRVGSRLRYYPFNK